MSGDDIIRTVSDVQYGQLNDFEEEILQYNVEEIVFEADTPHEKYTAFTVKGGDILVERTNLPSQRTEYFLYPTHIAEYTLESQLSEITQDSGFKVITHMNELGVEW